MKNIVWKTTISSLLISTCLLTTIKPLKANPLPTNPVITIITPTQQTYNASTLSLNIKVITQNDGYYFNSSERRISYSLDEKEKIQIDQTNYSYNEETKSSIVEASTVLTDLSDGTHEIIVFVEYDYDVKIIDSRASISFSINTEDQFSTIVNVASIATPIAIGLGILAYFKKYRK